MKQTVKKGLVHSVSNDQSHEKMSRHIPSSDAVTVPVLAYTDQLNPYKGSPRETDDLSREGEREASLQL